MNILKSASELFLQQGYERTSMDAVAKHSGVSKQTVYSHFNNKDVLYNAVIESKCVTYQLEESTECLENTELRDLLENIAVKFIELLSDPQVIDMYQVVIGEAKSYPHVAELFYQAGPVHSVELLTKLLMSHPQSALSAALARDLALDFFNLIKSDFHMRSLLHLSFSIDDEKKHIIAKVTTDKTLAILAMHQRQQ